jgi:hypothetical protein
MNCRNLSASCSGETDMTVQPHNAILKYRSLETKEQKDYPLSDEQKVVIGREPSCQIMLKSAAYQGVSRHHAELVSTNSENGTIYWKIRDLGSANGTFVNGQRLQKPRILENGDRVSLGQDGFEFIFESQSTASEVPVPDPDLIPATVYDRNPKQSPPIALPASQKSVRLKLLGSVLGIAAIFFFLNALPPQPPPQPQAQNPPASPSSPPLPSPQPFQTPVSPELADVDFQGTTLITSHFDVIGEGFSKAESDGENDLYYFEIKAKSSFQSSNVAYMVRFHNAAGDEISEPERLLYHPSPAQWTQGARGLAGFVVPFDRTDLKVIQFSR